MQRIIGYDINNRQYDLTMNLVKKNYEVAENLCYTTIHSLMKNNKIYSVPHGRPPIKQNIITFPTDGPIVKYQQGEEYACAAYSLASTLYVMGDTQMRHVIYEQIDNYFKQKGYGTMSYMAKIMRGDEKYVTLKLKKYKVRKIITDELEFDYIINNQTNDIKMFHIGVSHFVCVEKLVI